MNELRWSAAILIPFAILILVVKIGNPSGTVGQGENSAIGTIIAYCLLCLSPFVGIVILFWIGAGLRAIRRLFRRK